MSKRPVELKVHDELRQVLQGIAIPAKEQLVVFEDLCIPHALSGRFAYLAKQALRSRNHKPSVACRRALETVQHRLDDVVQDPEHECYSTDYVTRSPRFQAAREAAARALKRFGWPIAVPPRTILVKEVVYRATEVPNSLKPRGRGTRPWSGTDSRLRYHRALFAMLDIEPTHSAARERIVRQREAVCGRSFPASVVELLTTRGSFRLFHQNSNNDGLVTNTGGDDRKILRQLGDPEHVAQGYLQVAVENQGVVVFFVPLDGSDDPPVFHDNDELGLELPLSEIHWCHCTDTFSDFVFQMMTLWRFHSAGCEYRLDGRGPAPDAVATAALGKRFQAGPSKALPHELSRTFFTPHGIIRISHTLSKRVSPPLADWIIEADSPESLLELARGLGESGCLPPRLKLQAIPTENARRIKAALSRLRAEVKR
jgi:hypothetical protein